MNGAKERDWSMVVAGTLLCVLAGFIMVAPGLTLVTLTALIGWGLLISGCLALISYIRFRGTLNFSGWLLVSVIFNIFLGALLLLHPFVFANVIEWLLGFSLIALGVFECLAALRLRSAQVPLWGWALFAGIVEILCGLMFFLTFGTLAIFLAIFVAIRALSFIFQGLNPGRTFS